MIDSLYSNLRYVLELTLPMMFVSLVLLISVRISYLLKHKSKFVLHKEIFLLFFASYILCLFQVVTSQDINTSSGNNFVPFVEIMRYELFGKYFVKNIIGNVIMFIPYGFFVSKYASGKSFVLTSFLVFLASFSIECTQLAIGRVFDVDDIILNVLGGIIGYFIYRLFNKLYSMLPRLFKTNLFLNMFSIVILISAVVFVFVLMT